MIYNYGEKYSNIITNEIIDSWEGSSVILDGATGSGKTYFIFNTLNDYCMKNDKKILFLCNREALYRELEDIKYQGFYCIDVMLYQTLQSRIKKKEDIGEYDYIVCDEAHYMMSDAMFNVYTDISYDYIIDQSKTKTIIFMSGTAKALFNKLKADKVVKEEFQYTIPYSYAYVDKTTLFNKKKDVVNIIKNILDNSEDDKIIYFANSIEQAIEIYEEFKEVATLRCSKSTRNPIAKMLNNLDCIKTYDKNLITFEERLLVTTKALDNGVSLVDRNIKHIISDIFSLDSLQQSLGRKRPIDQTDTCNFYIRIYSKRILGNFKGNIKQKLNPIQVFKKDRLEYDEKYLNDREFHSNYIYFNKQLGDFTYNKLALWKLLLDGYEIETMERQGHKNILLKTLGDTLTNIVDLEELEKENVKSEVEQYLESNIGKQLLKEEQQELINIVGLKDSRNRLQKSIAVLSPYMEENYGLILDTDRPRIDGKKVTVWIINKSNKKK